MPIRAPATLNVLKRANAITTYSNETLNLLRELKLGKTSQLVPNFVNTRLFKRPTMELVQEMIVMVSRLSKPKDPMTPIRALPKL